MKESQSLQEKYAPNNACWGCGPANPDGLHIRSFPKNGEVVAQWKPEKLPLQLDGRLSSDEARERGSPAVHCHGGICNQIAPANADE